MKCPNCGKEAADEAAECAACSFVLSKWRAAQAGSPAPAAAPAPRRAQPEAEGQAGSLALFAVFLALAGYYWHSRAPAPVEADSGAALGPNSCALSGEVLDIYRVLPVGSVKLSFEPKAAGVTDAAGRYFVRVKAGKTYAVTLEHPRFKSGYVEGFSRDWREVPWDQRVRAARAVEAPATGETGSVPRDEVLQCDAGQERVFNFAIVPKTVTGDEQKEIDAVQ